MVLFPNPDGPTIAVDSPALMVKLTELNMFLISGGAVGYLNETSLNVIYYLRSKWVTGFAQSRIFGLRSITLKMTLPAILAAWIP